MTILYRSPDVIIDRFEWHVIVRSDHNHIYTTYRFRLIAAKRGCWRAMVEWVGPKPKGIGNRFWRYRSHVREAMEAPALREMALERLRGPATSAELRNAA